MSLEACRRLLEPSCGLSDAEVLDLRDQLYNFATIVVTLVPDAGANVTVDERAAIMEFDGGLPTKAAKAGAMILHMKGRR